MTTIDPAAELSSLMMTRKIKRIYSLYQRQRPIRWIGFIDFGLVELIKMNTHLNNLEVVTRQYAQGILRSVQSS